MQHNDDERPSVTPSRSLMRGGDYSLTFVLLATVGFFIARIPVLVHRVFDPDEFQHSHAAWCVFKGMVPYKDFFEHHTPWYYYMLSPFFHGFDVAGSFESARHFLLFGRGLSLVLTILSVFLVVRIGRLLADSRVGLLAGLFLVSQPVFVHKTIEIRPDVLALPFYLAGLWFLLRGLAGSGDGARRSFWHFLAAGLSVGAAIMCTQKMLFVLPGALAGLGIWALFARTKAGPRSRVLRMLVTLLGIAVPAALTLVAFSLQHAGHQFIWNNFLVNAKWKHIAIEQLIRVLKSSWPVLIFSLLGATVSFYRFVRSEQRQYGGVLLLCTLFGLMAGILVIPVAHRQYYLMLLPLACLFAAQGLSFLIERAREGARAWLLVLATLPLFVLPVLDLLDSLTSPNDAQLARLRYVFESTKPTDVVMDGWEGTGVFRPHAFYYYFLHEEAVAMLPRERVDAYVDALESGKIRPRLIAMDENLPLLGSRFLRFVKSHYTSSDGFFYFSNPDSSRPASAR
jgi:hypothetical protein